MSQKALVQFDTLVGVLVVFAIALALLILGLMAYLVLTL